MLITLWGQRADFITFLFISSIELLALNCCSGNQSPLNCNECFSVQKNAYSPQEFDLVLISFFCKFKSATL